MTTHQLLHIDISEGITRKLILEIAGNTSGQALTLHQAGGNDTALAQIFVAGAVFALKAHLAGHDMEAVMKTFPHWEHTTIPPLTPAAASKPAAVGSQPEPPTKLSQQQIQQVAQANVVAFLEALERGCAKPFRQLWLTGVIFAMKAREIGMDLDVVKTHPSWKGVTVVRVEKDSAQTREEKPENPDQFAI